MNNSEIYCRKFVDSVFKGSFNKFVYIFVFINLLIFNSTVYLYVINQNQDVTIFVIELLILILLITFGLTYGLITLFSVFGSKMIKVIVTLIIILNTVSLYFMNSYQVILDRTMMGNIFNTKYSESTEFLSANLIIYFLFFAVLPTIWIWNYKVTKFNNFSLLKHLSIQLVLIITLAYSFSSTWLWIDKHAKQLGGRILPWAYFINTGRYMNEKYQRDYVPEELPPITVIDPSKQLVMLVIGETARSHNFSLYGYERETNPELSKFNIHVLPNATSCSTYTTASIRCMLSHVETISSWVPKFETLPSYLSREGVDVTWISNNWGEPNIKVNSYIDSSELRKNYHTNECDYDGVMIASIFNKLDNLKNDKNLIVVHLKGSHGPLYNKRYPDEFSIYTPECIDVNLSKCQDNKLYNSYDNSILYTDHLLAKILKKLSSIEDYQSTFIYISDHGESLGEEGIYLHGTPISIAPSYQYEIPFLIWSNKNVSLKDNIQEFNQFNIFHTTLGSLGLSSSIYEHSKDVLIQNKSIISIKFD